MIDINSLGGAQNLKTMFQDPAKREMLVEALAKHGPPPDIPQNSQASVGSLMPGQVSQPYAQSGIGQELGGQNHAS